MTSRSHRSRSLRALMGAGALLTSVGLIAACGGGSDDKGSSEGASPDESTQLECPYDALKDIKTPVEIQLWHTQTGLPMKALDSIAKAYNESQDKVVVHTENQGTLDEQLKKFQDSMAQPKSLPEIIAPDDTVTRFMADSGYVIPATSCIKADPEAKAIYDDMVPFIKTAYTIDDTLWPGAFSAANAVLFYNQSHFEKAGLDINTAPKTLAEVRKVAETLKAANIPGVDKPMVLKVNPWIIEYFISGAGDHIVNEDNGRKGLATKSLYDNPASLETFTWIRDMYNDGLLKLTDYTQDVEPFIAMAFQTSSMLIDTSSAISTVDAAIAGTLTAEDVGLKEGDIDLSSVSLPDLRIGVGEMPGLKEAGKGQAGGTAWYLIDDEDPTKVAAAWDFMKYFNQPDVQAKWAIEGSSFPIRKESLKNKDLNEKWTTTRVGKWMATAYKGFETLDPENPGPVIGPYKEFRQSVRRGLEGIVSGSLDPAGAVKQIDTELQGELDSYKKDLEG